MTRGGTLATEVLWYNYPRPAVLHDYRYVGDEYRARQRLRKKIRRAVADLASMPPLERGAMFSALAGAVTGDELRAAIAAARAISGPGARAESGGHARTGAGGLAAPTPAGPAGNGAAISAGPLFSF